MLLRAGARVSAKALDGATPLHVAVGNGSEATVKLLLSAHASVNAGDEVGEAPLHFAVRESRGCLVDLLLSYGANPNIANEDGETPLHLAASYGEFEISQALLKAGAKADAVDCCGVTPADLAARSDNSGLLSAFQVTPEDVLAQQKPTLGQTPSCSAQPTPFSGGLCLERTPTIVHSDLRTSMH
eukprot:TRINITY_DN16968_c0_g1_i1.p2 TRINITY_DN16968_c0_g1~~TRINITY_DN16968_c0_g1_i1.p2  ORF type:complete len:185 (+),score=19.34 TRINITY_DN16968_c0_g1_i1:487-1041(+)